MKNFPLIEACFFIEGKQFNLESFTERVGILPSKTRTVDDWPEELIKNSNIPEELQPRYVWQVCAKEETCMRAEIPILQVMSQLEGKEGLIINFCAKESLKKGLNISIHAEIMNMPEIVLAPEIVSFFAKLEAEISFDLYGY